MLREQKIKNLLQKRFPSIMEDIEKLAEQVNDPMALYVDKYLLFKILFTGVEIKFKGIKKDGKRMHVMLVMGVPYDVERELFDLLGEKEDA